MLVTSLGGYVGSDVLRYCPRNTPISSNQHTQIHAISRGSFFAPQTFLSLLNLLLHLCLWFFLPYPGLQKHDDTPRWVLQTSCFSRSHVESSPTMHVSILKGKVSVFTLFSGLIDLAEGPIFCEAASEDGVLNSHQVFAHLLFTAFHKERPSFPILSDMTSVGLIGLRDSDQFQSHRGRKSPKKLNFFSRLFCCV